MLMPLRLLNIIAKFIKLFGISRQMQHYVVKGVIIVKMSELDLR
jgi:hypothetical protein